VFFTDLPDNDDKSAADEGTAAGELLQMQLERWEKQPGHAKNGVVFDSDMYFYTGDVAKRILAKAESVGSKVMCEDRVDWVIAQGMTLRGQYDAAFFGNDNTLYVYDLKYGWGIVDVFENWQLIGYAIGKVLRAWEANSTVPTRIVLTIEQPRPHHEDGSTRTWELTLEQLWKYKAMIESKAAQVVAGDRTVATGSKCKYCPAFGGACTAANRTFYNSIETALHRHVQDDLSNEEIARQLDLIGRAAEILKIKKDSLEQLAIYRTKQGKVVPGYTVDENFGDRKWKAEMSPQAIKLMTGVDIITQSTMSPRQAEIAGVPKQLVNALVTRPFLGPKLKKQDSTKLADKLFGNKPAIAEGEKR